MAKLIDRAKKAILGEKKSRKDVDPIIPLSPPPAPTEPPKGTGPYTAGLRNAPAINLRGMKNVHCRIVDNALLQELMRSGIDISKTIHVSLDKASRELVFSQAVEE